MSIILSLSANQDGLWAAGPDGLFRVEDDGTLTQLPQPQQNLYCCAAIHDRVLVGGLPYGAALSMTPGEDWRAGWLDTADAPVVMFAADPEVEQSGVILAATDGGGILRTINRGDHWYSRNFGLRSYSVLALTWAPVAPKDVWPRWQTVFACTEEGVYHSPNGGRGWKRSECPEAVYQCIAVGQDFHTTGLVLAGTEANGLFRSTDGGRHFVHVPDAPSQVNAVAATAGGWLLSDAERIYHSTDGLQWTATGLAPALVFLQHKGQMWAGTEDGVMVVDLQAEPASV